MNQLAQAIAALREGALVCFPTESSYGLAADPYNERALAALAKLKGRSASAPIALIAGNLEQAHECTGRWPERAQELAKAHWPGPLTLILPPSPEVGAACIGQSGGVGVRISSVEVARSLALGLGHAITATSANPSGAPAATSLAQAEAYFGRSVGCYLDGGKCDGRPSTLVQFCENGRVQVLREGPIVLLPANMP